MKLIAGKRDNEVVDTRKERDLFVCVWSVAHRIESKLAKLSPFEFDSEKRTEEDVFFSF